MSSKIKKRKLWILSASILGLGGGIVLTTIQCSDDTKVEKVVEINLPSGLQTKTKMTFIGKHGVGRIDATFNNIAPNDSYDIWWSVGTKTTFGNKKIKTKKDLTHLKNGDYVWIEVKVKDGKKFKKNKTLPKGWMHDEIENVLYFKKLVSGLEYKVISIASLPTNDLSFMGKNGIGRSSKPIINSHYSDKATFKLHKGDQKDKIGIAKNNLDGLANGDYVWLVATTTSDYVWPKNVPGWVHQSTRVIKKRFLVKNLEESTINIPSGLPNLLTFEKRSDTGWTLKNPNIAVKPEDYQIQWSKTIDPDNFGTVITINQIKNLNSAIHQYIWIKIIADSTSKGVKTFASGLPSDWNYLNPITKRILIFKQHLRPLVEFPKISFFDTIKKSLSLPNSIPTPKINPSAIGGVSANALRSKNNLDQWPLITYSQYTLQMYTKIFGHWGWTKYASVSESERMSLMRRPYLIAWDFTIKLTPEEKTKKLKRSQKTFVFGKHVVFVSLQARGAQDYLNQLSPDIPNT